MLLGILDKATLTLGDNRRVDLSQMHDHHDLEPGRREITDLMEGGMGFAPKRCRPTTRSTTRLTDGLEAARRKFAPEFMNRIDKVVVFHPLRGEQLEQILEIELGMVQQRVLTAAGATFVFHCTPPVKNSCCRKGRTRNTARAT